MIVRGDRPIPPPRARLHVNMRISETGRTIGRSRSVATARGNPPWASRSGFPERSRRIFPAAASPRPARRGTAGGGPQVPAARRGGQRVQDGLDHRGALWAEIAVDLPGTVQGGVQGHALVGPRSPSSLGSGWAVWARISAHIAASDRRLRARPGGSAQDLLSLAPALIRHGAGPPGQLQGDRLGEHDPSASPVSSTRWPRANAWMAWVPRPGPW